MKNQVRVLIVDDNFADCNLFRRYVETGFKREGIECSVDFVGNSIQCFEKLAHKEFDCLLLDYLLGESSGLEVLNHMRKLSIATPVIVFTGEGAESIAVAAMKLGADDYFVKEEVTPESIARSILKAIEKKILRHKLAEKQRELEDFAFTAAHDIKAPLAAIHQVSHLLKWKLKEIQEGQNRNHADTQLDSDFIELNEYASVLIQKTEGLTEFLTQLLNYAKAGRSEVSFRLVSLMDVLSKVYDHLASQREACQAQILIETDLPSIWADETAMVQLFQNLLSNAMKFSKPGEVPLVRVRCEVENQSVGSARGGKSFRFVVQDNGVGVPEEAFEEIFAPLVRFNSGAGREGSGLGLSVVKKIIDQHQGRIWLESSLGQGLSVYFVLHEHLESIPVSTARRQKNLIAAQSDLLV